MTGRISPSLLPISNWFSKANSLKIKNSFLRRQNHSNYFKHTGPENIKKSRPNKLVNQFHEKIFLNIFHILLSSQKMKNIKKFISFDELFGLDFLKFSGQLCISSTYLLLYITYKTPPPFEKNLGSTFEWIIYRFWNFGRTSAPKNKAEFYI